MGTTDQFNEMEPKTELEEGAENEEYTTAGWDSITEAAEKVYPTQKNPKHYGTLIKWMLGGDDPLDGISIYDGGDFWHFVTYGLSELYEKENDNTEFSGYGMEFTLKLKKYKDWGEETELRCICGILQSIARITFTQGELFQAFEYVYTGQTQGIDAQMKSNITGFITVPDPTIPAIESPYGKVDLIEFVGATDAELTAIQNNQLTVKELYEKLGTDFTDYHRDSIV